MLKVKRKMLLNTGLLASMITISFTHIMTAGNVQLKGLMPVFQGTVDAEGQTENAIKHRINAGDKANNANDQTVASIFDNKFCIPLDFEFLKSSFAISMA